MIYNTIFLKFIRVLLAFLAIAASASSLLAPGNTVTAQSLGANDEHANDYLIRFVRSGTRAERAQVVGDLGGTLVTWMAPIEVASVRFPDPETAQRALAAIARGQTVLWSEPDGMVWADAAAIADPEFNDVQHGYGQRLVQLEAAWSVTLGESNIIVAVVDSGLDLNHPEFAGRIVAGYDFVNHDDDPTDDNGHGTHVTGIVAMAIDGVGSAGMCPSCSIMPLKVLGANNGGQWSSVAQAILYATDHGARIINLSLGSHSYSSTIAEAIAYARDHAVIVVASAGNGALAAPYYPAAFDSVLAVVATDANDERWPLSNYGPWVDVAAPGVSIYSTFVQDGAPTYRSLTGTSMAVPFVSGLAALVLSAYPELTPQEVVTLILVHADDLGEPGRDDIYGHGRINAARTLGAEGDEVDFVYGNSSARPDNDHKVFLPTIVMAIVD